MAANVTALDSLNKYPFAVFAGGCFWCVESDFDHVPGVISTISGYAGGELLNPTYRNHGNHIEAVQIHFDPEITNYATLLEVFWRSVDPTDSGGQFCDRGHSYLTAIFTNSIEQQRIAESSKVRLEAQGILSKPIVTDIRVTKNFYQAEDYHQNYYKENPLRYKFYRNRCGRDARVRELWEEQAHQGIDPH